MSEDLVFYTNPMSRGRMVRWMLEEVGAPHRTVVLDYGTTMKSPDYLAINPMGKVPAIQHKGVIVTEVAAICAYLADAFPEAGLAPATSDPVRGTYLRWLFFAAGPMEAAIGAKALNLIPPADKAGMVGYGSFEQMLATLEGAVAGDGWLCGDRFTAADLYLGSQLMFGLTFKLLPESAPLLAYAERLRARPAWARAEKIDNDLIAAAKG